jgi:hypothetical protein
VYSHVGTQGPRPRSSLSCSSVSVRLPKEPEPTLDQIAYVFKPAEPQNDVSFRLSRRYDRKFDVGSWAHKQAVSAAYKRKADKVQPMDVADPSGDNPRRSMQWKQEALARIPPARLNLDPYCGLITPRMSTKTRGFRLTLDRVQNLKIGQQLLKNERDLLLAVLFNREGGLAWDFSHIGRIREDVAPPQVIRTTPHKAWQAPTFHVPRALEPAVIQILRERMDASVLELGQGPYRNPWFLVKKAVANQYRLINAAMYINRHTIRDANLPPNLEEFVEEFAGLKAVSLVDMQSGYDQVPLAVKSRDLTGFQTPMGLLRNCTIIQGGTNSVAQFCRIMTQILEDLIPNIARVFVDDIGVKGPRTDYDGVEALPGIRKYILESIQNLDKVLTNVECAGGCVSGSKSQFVVENLKIVGFVCGPEGRMPEATKVLKILEWPPCQGLEEARAFIGICVYFRLWVKDFAAIAAPIYVLFKKGQVFRWEPEQQEAMDQLKLCLTNPPAIQPLDYSEGAGEIILASDASLVGWGSVLMQTAKDKKRRHVCRYDSGIWTTTESAYDAGKRECRALMKALKKVRHYLYGVFFTIEVDARTLVAQLNKSAVDVPGALLNRWLAWIRLFDFDVRHVAGRKHLAADGLSRRPWVPEDDKESEEDVEEFLDNQLDRVGLRYFALVGELPEEDDSILNPESHYTEEHEQYARYLTTLRKPEHLGGRQFTKFKKEATKFLVKDGELFRRGSKSIPLRRVVDGEADKQEIITYQHDHSGHRGVEATYRRVANLYWWDGLYKDVKKYCTTCRNCQLRSKALQNDSIFSTYASALFEKVSVDVVKMPLSRGKGYLAVAREDVSGWVEARALKDNDSASIARFLWEEVITKHGIFGRLICDGGPENKKWVKDLVALYGVDRIVVSAYNPHANGMVERGHKPIVDSLSKLTNGGHGSWSDLLHLVLWADRTTVRQSTGKTPFELLYGYMCVLPIEAKVTTWNTLPWHTVRTRADLLAMRAEQILRRDLDLEEATARVERMRKQGKEYQDEAMNAVDSNYNVGDLVLLHNSRWKEDNSASRKLGFWWLGPYRVISTNHRKGNYTLQELDGTIMQGTVPGRRLKPYYSREHQETVINSSTGTSTEDSEDGDDAGRVPAPLLGRRHQSLDDSDEYSAGSASDGSSGSEGHA